MPVSSSDLKVRKDTVRSGMYILNTTLWFYFRKDRWPNAVEFSRAASFLVENRQEAMQWLYRSAFLIRELDSQEKVQYRVTTAGIEFVTPPSLEEALSLPLEERNEEYLEKMALPDDPDEFDLVVWLHTYHKRRDAWPKPGNFGQCGLYQRDKQRFWDALERLTYRGKIALIQIRRGRHQNTYMVDTFMCPQFEGRDGHIFFSSSGPFPEG